MVTMRDVAREAGVSKATVSYVSSGSPLISAATTEKVHAAMKKLGYHVNKTARSLSTSKTQVIGIFSPIHQDYQFSLSMGTYLYGISEAARRRGYDVMLLTNPDGVEAIRAASASHYLDGAIVLDVRSQDKRVQAVREADFPTVFLGVPDDVRGIDVVDTDFEQAAHDFVARLKNRRLHEVTFIGWPHSVYSHRLNYALRFRSTLLNSCEQEGIDIHQIYAEETILGSSEVIDKAVEEYPSSKALIIHNDAVAVGAFQAFARLGISIPDQMYVAALVPDELEFGMSFPIDSISISISQVAETALDVLLTRINTPDTPSQKVLVGQPFVRGHH